MAQKSGIKNLKAFQDKLERRIVDNPEKHLKTLVTRCTLIVENHAKQSIASGSPSGRTYTRGGISHTASAAGEPPATDTGFLVSNITSSVKTEGTQVIGQIIASAPYAKPLEFGTTNMSPRPFMQPALNKNRSKIKRIFKEGGYIK
jgi:HK97 gp10 family phage protein